MMCCKPKAALEPSLGDLPASVEQLKSCPRLHSSNLSIQSAGLPNEKSRQGCKCTSTVLPGVAYDSPWFVWVVCTFSLLGLVLGSARERHPTGISQQWLMTPHCSAVLDVAFLDR